MPAPLVSVAERSRCLMQEPVVSQLAADGYLMLLELLFSHPVADDCLVLEQLVSHPGHDILFLRSDHMSSSEMHLLEISVGVGCMMLELAHPDAGGFHGGSQ